MLLKKYVVYAIGDHGDGYIQKMGEYNDPTEIRIHVGLFDRDVVINIEEEDAT